ncbi:homocysteine S-methyltransferase family protein [Pseudomonas fulva]|uniref:homocysteine S-methyltransferase family protein n=1 Tax=Pseudomonas fulva TaxID=47880 RepID=UPI0018A9AA98|nr:homocysteine S-methyltransferase family protein [Pseudomonas fulva]
MVTTNSYAVVPLTCATIIGGCCGIRPEHIEQLHEHIGIEPEGIAPSGGRPIPAAVLGEARPRQLPCCEPGRPPRRSRVTQDRLGFTLHAGR